MKNNKTCCKIIQLIVILSQVLSLQMELDFFSRPPIVQKFYVPLYFDKKNETMALVSSKEFISNQRKCFDLAKKEDVYIQNGGKRFHLKRY